MKATSLAAHARLPAADAATAPAWLRPRALVQGRSGQVALAVAGWTLLAALPTTSAYIAMRGEGYELWFRFFRPVAIYYYIWGLCTPLIYLMVARLPMTPARAPWSLLAHLAFLGGVSALAVFPCHGPGWREWLYGSRALAYHTMSAFSYAFIIVGCLAYRYYHDGLEKEREAAAIRLRAARLDGQLSLAQIDALRMQINPHFLFNALNSIAALVETDRSREAYRTIELLGGLLRSALDTSRRPRVALREEIDFVERYLEIERIRFGSRLSFACRVEDDVAELEIPALLLQPIVENAVKHAVARVERPVSVTLGARCEGEWLLLEVGDDGPGMGQGGSGDGAGQGLRNVRERLRLVYGGEAELALDRSGPRGTRVTLRLPARRGPPVPGPERNPKRPRHVGSER